MGVGMAEVEGSDVEVRLEDGRSFVAHACVGCDGIHWRMRGCVLGSSWTALGYLAYISHPRHFRQGFVSAGARQGV